MYELNKETVISCKYVIYILPLKNENSKIMIQAIKYLIYLNRNLFPRTTLDLQKKGGCCQLILKKKLIQAREYSNYVFL